MRLPQSERPSKTISPGRRHFETFRNTLLFYGEGLLASRPASKLEDYPLSAVRDCLFNIFAAILHICRPSPPSTTEDAPCRGDKGPTCHGPDIIRVVKSRGMRWVGHVVATREMRNTYRILV
jgi:hypothetical protein